MFGIVKSLFYLCTMITSHIQWKDYMVLNNERIYVHAVVINENGTSLKAIKDDKNVLIRVKPTDIIH